MKEEGLTNRGRYFLPKEKKRGERYTRRGKNAIKAYPKSGKNLEFYMSSQESSKRTSLAERGNDGHVGLGRKMGSVCLAPGGRRGGEYFQVAKPGVKGHRTKTKSVPTLQRIICSKREE